MIDGLLDLKMFRTSQESVLLFLYWIYRSYPSSNTMKWIWRTRRIRGETSSSSIIFQAAVVTIIPLQTLSERLSNFVDTLQNLEIVILFTNKHLLQGGRVVIDSITILPEHHSTKLIWRICTKSENLVPLVHIKLIVSWRYLLEELKPILSHIRSVLCYKRSH